MRSRTCAHWAAKASSSPMSWMVKLWRSVHPTVSDPRLRPPACNGMATQASLPVVSTTSAIAGAKTKQAARSGRTTVRPVRAAALKGRTSSRGTSENRFLAQGGEAVGHHQPEDVAIPDPDRRTMRSEGLQPAHGDDAGELVGAVRGGEVQGYTGQCGEPTRGGQLGLAGRRELEA